MKQLVMAALTAAALLTMLLSGCGTKVQTYSEPGQTINTGVNREFTIALGSNPTTGYGWQPAYDTNALNLLGKTYKPQDNTGKQLVGAGGTEYFNFKALNKGETKVTLAYRRPWEQPTPQDKTVVFTVDVK